MRCPRLCGVALWMNQARGFCFQSNAAIRAPPTDDESGDTDLEVDCQTHIWLDALADSDLLREADPSVRDKIGDLAAARAAKGSGKSKAARAMIAEARAFEAMILLSIGVGFHAERHFRRSCQCSGGRSASEPIPASGTGF